MPILWRAFRDTGIYLFAALAALEIKIFFRKNHFITFTAQGVRNFFIIFFVVWLANCIAVVCSSTTLSDDLGGPTSGYSAKVPATLVVTTIVGFLAFIVLLFMGQID
jgi:hypothetical protein